MPRQFSVPARPRCMAGRHSAILHLRIGQFIRGLVKRLSILTLYSLNLLLIALALELVSISEAPSNFLILHPNNPPPRSLRKKEFIGFFLIFKIQFNREERSSNQSSWDGLQHLFTGLLDCRQSNYQSSVRQTVTIASHAGQQHKLQIANLAIKIVPLGS